MSEVPMAQLAYGRGNAVARPPSKRMRAAFDHAWAAAGWAASGQMSTVVALVDTRQWLPWLSEAKNLLDPAETMRAERRRIIADREALVLAYALHRLLLGAILTMGPMAVPLFRDARGCPRVANCDIHTSLSHADGHVALAVSAVGPVGIDIEPATRTAVMAEISASVCHPAEAAALAGLSEPDRSAALLALWVRKEAVLKAAGIGLMREMASFEAPADSCPRLPWLPGGACRIRMLDAGETWVAAVASAADVSVSTIWLHPLQ